MHSSRRWGWLRATMTALAALVVMRLLWVADLAHTWQLLRGAGPALVLVLVPFLVGMSLDTLGWRLILGGMGHVVRFPSLLSIRLATEAVLLSVPGGGVAAEVLKPVLLSRVHDVPLAQGAASVGVKKALYVTADAVYMGLGLVGGYAFLRELARAMGGGPTALVLPSLVVILVVLLFFFGLLFLSAFNKGTVAGRVFGVLGRVPHARFQRWIEARRQGFLAVDHTTRSFFRGGPVPVGSAFLLFFLQWLTEAGETYLIVRLLGIEASFFPVLAFESLNSFVRSLAFFVPAGLGIQDMGQVLFAKAMGATDAASVGAALLVAKRGKELFWTLTGYGLLARVRRAA